jgi:uncharacterized membrane protein
MPWRYQVSVYLHVLSAVVWLGGMVVFGLLAPVLRRIEDERARQALFQTLGQRFRTLAWICLGLLVVTGIEQLRIRGWWGVDVWSAGGFRGSGLGRSLMAKLALATVMIGIQAAHDFWLGPRAGRVPAGTEEARTLRHRAAWLARVNVVLGLVLIWLAVAVARGGRP